MRAVNKYQSDNRDPSKPEQTQTYPGALSSGAQALDPFELALVISIAGQIAQKGQPNIYQLILMELREMYREEPGEKFVSVCWRLFSLYKLIQSGALHEYVPLAALQRNLPLPSPVVFIAATLPLKDSRGFDEAAFLTALREVSASKP